MRKWKRSIVLCIVLVFTLSLAAAAADKGEFSIAPTKKDGKKWRVGYYEGGEYIDYQTTLVATADGLMSLGWIEKIQIPEQEGNQTKELWNWLADNAKSDYIEFVKDAHYSANWDKELRPKMSQEIIERLKGKGDIDLMIATGTWAGQDLAKAEQKTPTIVVSTSDPIKAGIIDSVEDSGNDYIHARVYPTRYARQIQLFHQIAGFKKLGVAYENTDTGRVYASIEDVEEIAQKLGFEVVSCYTQSDIPDEKATEQSVIECFEELGKKKVDAIYVTRQRGVNDDSLPKIAETAISHKIPTFSQSGSKEVRYGLLLSVAKAGFRDNGIFHAQTMAKIFNGAKPRQLDQVFENPQKIAINLKTAESIRFDLPMEFVEIIDETYNEIEKPE